MAINDTVQLIVEGVANNQTHLHTLHFRYSDLTSGEQDLIDSWQAGCRTAYRALFQVSDPCVQLLRAQQVCGTIPLRAPVEEAEAPATQNGTAATAGDRCPAWLAAVVSWRTAFAGKSRRGRSFIGGLWEANCAGDNINAAYKALLQAYVDALMGIYGPTGTSTKYELVVHSHKLASVPGTACQDSSTIITSALVRDAIGSMKSRKHGSGT